jgi:four helix bundle protein
MKENNIIVDKTYGFAVKIILLYKQLTADKKEFVISKQLVRCGTSIGANVEEGLAGESKKDFISKFSIALKESRETHYWLRLLRDTGFIDNETSSEHLNDCEEILRILSSIVKTSKQPKKIINS